MYLVLLCPTEFFAIAIALWLSSKIYIGDPVSTLRLASIWHNQIASWVAEPSAIYSASAIDKATIVDPTS